MTHNPTENDIPEGIFFRWLGLMLAFAMLVELPISVGGTLGMLPLAIFLLNGHLPVWFVIPYLIGLLIVGFFAGFRVGVQGADWSMKRFFKTDMAQWD